MRVLTSVKPTEIREGDEIVNVGVAVALRTEGVFTSVEVAATTWSTVTGRGRDSMFTVTFHASEPVTVARHPESGITLVTPDGQVIGDAYRDEPQVITGSLT